MTTDRTFTSALPCEQCGGPATLRFGEGVTLQCTEHPEHDRTLSRTA